MSATRTTASAVRAGTALLLLAGCHHPDLVQGEVEAALFFLLSRLPRSSTAVEAVVR